MLLGLAYQLTRFLTDLLLARTGSNAQLRAEVLALRYQLRVLERKGRQARLAARRSCPVGCLEPPTLGAKGDLKLLAEEQILDDEVPTAADGGDDSGKCEPDEVEHGGSIADQPWADRRVAFCPPSPVARTLVLDAGWGLCCWRI